MTMKWIVLLLLGGCCVAQTLISVTEKPSAECENQLRVVRESLIRFPQDWTVKVVCTDLSWDTIKKAADMPDAVAFTRIEPRKTYIQGTALTHPQRFSPDFVLAHERGHIEVGPDCRKANRFAEALLRSSQQPKFHK